MDDFTEAYIACALWTGIERAEDDKDYDCTRDDLSAETLERMIKDCADFQAVCGDIIDAAEETGDVRHGPDCDTVRARAGHDFWLTRNGHGAGFWDGDWPEPMAGKLTHASKRFGEWDLYVGDDGVVYGT